MSIENLSDWEKTKQDITEGLNQQWLQDIQVNISKKETLSTVLVSLPFKDDSQVKEVSESIRTILTAKWHITNEDNIVWLSLNGPSVSEYMKSSTITALAIGILFIAVYMMFSFASMRKHISPLTLALVTIATMLFDIAIPAGWYWLRMMIDSTVTVDTVFVIAILTTMWYSINDTIIILDRIRENVIKHKDGLENGSILYGDIFETSLWQTMRRSLWTGLSTLLAITAMYIFGESVMQSFAFTMGIGIIAGAFSSIFLWAPLAYLLLGTWKREFKKM